jgi:hypothetical protein
MFRLTRQRLWQGVLIKTQMIPMRLLSARLRPDSINQSIQHVTAQLGKLLGKFGLVELLFMPCIL